MATGMQARQGLTTRVRSGVIAGLAGGIAFGALMAAMGMLPMVAMLVGSESALVGGLVHLVISAGLGVSFALVVPALATVSMLAAGAGYGLLWWVLGPLLIMPTLMGMPGMIFAVDTAALMSLVGHLIYGVVVAGVLLALRGRVARA